jgi:hypothetical protein
MVQATNTSNVCIADMQEAVAMGMVDPGLWIIAVKLPAAAVCFLVTNASR